MGQWVQARLSRLLKKSIEGRSSAGFQPATPLISAKAGKMPALQRASRRLYQQPARRGLDVTSPRILGGLLALLALLAFLPASPKVGSSAAKPGREASPGFRLKDFIGVQYLPSPETCRALGIGWTRENFYWSNIEPAKGKWNWAETDQRVLQAHAQGVEVLPMLGYTAPWAEAPGQPGKWSRKLVADWQDYVEHVAARYGQPPFNLRYFQVWNEPTREAGFWKGANNREFIDRVYLPAAKIIRRYHCYVVFGGWPLSNGLQEFDEILAYQSAWKWTDILDVHYYGPAAWPHLYGTWIKTGKCRGIWQTEIGFTEHPDYLPIVYLPILYQSLEYGARDPDQFKLFWYASWGAGPDAEKCLTRTGPQGKTLLTFHGKQLALLNEVMGQGSLAPFADFSTTPKLGHDADGNLAVALGFKVGNSVVIAFLIDKSTLGRYFPILVRMPLVRKPDRVEFTVASGERHQLETSYQGGNLQVVIPLQEVQRSNSPGKVFVGYLQIEQG